MENRSSSLQLAIQVAGFLLIFWGIASVVSAIFTFTASYGTFRLIFGEVINETEGMDFFKSKYILITSIFGTALGSFFKILIGYLAIKNDQRIIRLLKL